VSPDPIFEEEPSFKADRDAVWAFMKFVDAIAEPADRSAFIRGEEGNASLEGIPEELARALKTMSEEELAFLASLRDHVQEAKLYDQYNPTLFYL
jgi:hypothetical protein